MLLHSLEDIRLKLSSSRLFLFLNMRERYYEKIYISYSFVSGSTIYFHIAKAIEIEGTYIYSFISIYVLLYFTFDISTPYALDYIVLGKQRETLFRRWHFTINRNINLRLCRDEKDSSKKVRLSAKHEPLNTDAKVNWHLYIWYLFFFQESWGTKRGRWEREIARTQEREDTRDRWAAAVSRQTVSNCVVFCFLYVRWSELWNRHRSNFGNKITVYRRYPFGVRDGNVTPSTPHCPFPRSVTSCIWRRIILLFLNYRIDLSSGIGYPRIRMYKRYDNFDGDIFISNLRRNIHWRVHLFISISHDLCNTETFDRFAWSSSRYIFFPLVVIRQKNVAIRWFFSPPDPSFDGEFSVACFFSWKARLPVAEREQSFRARSNLDGWILRNLRVFCSTAEDLSGRNQSSNPPSLSPSETLFHPTPLFPNPSIALLQPWKLERILFIPEIISIRCLTWH